MQYSVRENSGTREVFVNGRFTFSDNEAFQGIISSLGEPGLKRCVLDMSGLEFIDSAGLGMLLLARDAASEAKVDVVLRGTRGLVRKMLDIAKFESIVPLED